MKNLSYPQVIHIKLWITFFEKFFKKSIDKITFMYYNIITVKERR